LKILNLLKSGINPDVQNNLGEKPAYLYFSLNLDNLDSFFWKKNNLVNYILYDNKPNQNLFNKSKNQTPFH